MVRAGWLIGCMVVLAGLDITGALLAQEYAKGHVLLTLVLGALTFVALFVVYAFSLRYAQLSIVTMGWIVLLQVGLLIIDLAHANLRLDRGQLLAILAILVLQCYLVVSIERPPAAADRPHEAGPAVVADHPFAAGSTWTVGMLARQIR